MSDQNESKTGDSHLDKELAKTQEIEGTDEEIKAEEAEEKIEEKVEEVDEGKEKFQKAQQQEEEEEKEAEKKKEEKKEDEKVEEEIKTEEEIEEKEETEEKEDEEPRYPYVALNKHQKLKEKYRELEKDLQSLKEKGEETKEEVTSENIEKLFEKHGVDDKNKSFLNDLLGIIEKKVGVSKDVLDKIQSSIAESERIKQEKYLDQQFNEEYQNTFFELDKSGKVKTDDKGTPMAKEGYEHANKLQKRVHELAFTKQFKNTPVEAIYLYAQSKMPKSKKTAESSSSSTTTIERSKQLNKSFADIKPEDIPKMDIATYEKYQRWEEDQYESQGIEVSRDGRKVIT
jgi:hypothetical protein